MPTKLQPLNIVLVRNLQEPQALEDLVDFVRKARGNFDPEAHHVFLFSEDYFGNSFRGTHLENKQKIKLIQEALSGTNWHLAFAHNEKSTVGVSNTGYFVSPDKYSAYPKIDLPESDYSNISNGDNNKPEVLRNVLLGWLNRSSKMEPMAFRVHDIGGHKVELRVCADSRVPTRKNNRIITLVPALNLTPNETGLGDIPKKRGLVVINDSGYSFQRERIFHDGTEFFLRVRKHFASANERLTSRKIRLHFY